MKSLISRARTRSTRRHWSNGAPICLIPGLLLSQAELSRRKTDLLLQIARQYWFSTRIFELQKLSNFLSSATSQ